MTCYRLKIPLFPWRNREISRYRLFSMLFKNSAQIFLTKSHKVKNNTNDELETVSPRSESSGGFQSIQAPADINNTDQIIKILNNIVNEYTLSEQERLRSTNDEIILFNAKRALEICTEGNLDVEELKKCINIIDINPSYKDDILLKKWMLAMDYAIKLKKDKLVKSNCRSSSVQSNWRTLATFRKIWPIKIGEF